MERKTQQQAWAMRRSSSSSSRPQCCPAGELGGAAAGSVAAAARCWRGLWTTAAARRSLGAGGATRCLQASRWLFGAEDFTCAMGAFEQHQHLLPTPMHQYSSCPRACCSAVLPSCPCRYTAQASCSQQSRRRCLASWCRQPSRRGRSSRGDRDRSGYLSRLLQLGPAALAASAAAAASCSQYRGTSLSWRCGVAQLPSSCCSAPTPASSPSRCASCRAACSCRPTCCRQGAGAASSQHS